MFINTDLKEFSLNHPINNTKGDLRIGLIEFFYRVKWFNISAEKGNNWVKQFNNSNIISTVTLNDGYYGFCELKEELKDGYGIILSVSNANLKVTLTFKAEKYAYKFAKKLAIMLGFKSNIFNVHANKYKFEGEHPLNLQVNSPLYVYIDQLSLLENVYNGQPSGLLRVVPSTDNASYCKYEVKTFVNPQYKKLKNEVIDRLCIRIKDRNGNEVNCEDFYMVLEVQGART